jgi:phosphoribosylformylglycinamidine synthase
VFLHNMAGSLLPIATAHGEGRADFGGRPVPERLVTLRYVDSDGNATEHYPQNPNGSPRGITGLCNADGRVTILMPHPERSLRGVNLSWAPPDWRKPARPGALDESPWLRMFRNARRWVG